MKKHFVTFYSPGTFVAESTTKPIPSWDVKLALEMVKFIVERHNATPYAFHFSTREQGEEDLDSRETKTSNLYYLHGKVETLAQVKARALPKEKILLSNMECNGWDRIITSTRGWKWTQPLHKSDVVLNVE
jgi:hypothetical protein